MRPKLVIGIDFGISVAWSYEGRDYIQVINDWPTYVKSLKYPVPPNSYNDVGTQIPSLIYYQDKQLAWGFEAQYHESPLAWFNVSPETTRGSPSLRDKYLTEDEQNFRSQCPPNKIAEDVAADYLKNLWNYTLQHITNCMGKDWTDKYRPQISLSSPAFWSTKKEKAINRVVHKAGLEEFATVGFVSKAEATALAVVERLGRLGTERKKIRQGEIFITCDVGKSAAELNIYQVENVYPLQLVKFLSGDGVFHSSLLTLDAYVRFLIGEEKYIGLGLDQRDLMLRKLETSIRRSFLERNTKDEYRIDLWGALRPENASPKIGTPIGFTLCPMLDHICQVVKDLVMKQIGLVRNKFIQSKITVVLVGEYAGSPYLFDKIQKENKFLKVNFRQAHNIYDSVCRGVVLHELVRSISRRPSTLAQTECPKLCVENIPLKEARGGQQRPLRILSLDGGGVRGLSSLIVLKKIMTKLEDRKQIPTGTAPWEYFDMMGGTSTGGLIALLLGRLRMSINECIEIYMDLARDIFGKAKGLQTATMFSSTKLEETINRAIQMKLEGGTQRRGNSCPVFVVAVDKERASAIEGLSLFRSYLTGINDEFKDVSIVQAARATTAAPTYFKPQAIVNSSGVQKHFVDGGLGHNNPLFSVLDEAERNYPCAEIGCVISIGTGVQDGIKLAVEGGARQSLFKIPIIGKLAAILDTGLVAAALATSSESVHHFALSRFRSTGIYYRFNFPNNDGIKLFDYQKMETLKEATEKYLDEISTRNLLRKCTSQLRRVDDPANAMKIRNKRRLFSRPGDLYSVVEHTINPELIGNLLRMPDPESRNSVDIPPESIWLDVDSYKTVPLRKWAKQGEISPVGHLGMSFNVLRGGQPPNRTHLKVGRSHRPRLYRFPALEVGEGCQIPSGRWKAKMIFILQGTDASESLRQKCMQITLSVFILDEDDEPVIEPDEAPSVSATTLSVPVEENCAVWEQVEASESFEVLEGEQIIFELGWDLELAGVQFAENSSLLFGGIRLSAED